jgi:predicted secreted protein
MNWFTGILLFVVIWWLVFFMALPFGVRNVSETGEDQEAGHDQGAPVNPRLWVKVGATTLITAAIMALILASIEFEWIDYRKLFDRSD